MVRGRKRLKDLYFAFEVKEQIEALHQSGLPPGRMKTFAQRNGIKGGGFFSDNVGLVWKNEGSF